MQKLTHTPVEFKALGSNNRPIYHQEKYSTVELFNGFTVPLQTFHDFSRA